MLRVAFILIKYYIVFGIIVKALGYNMRNCEFLSHLKHKASWISPCFSALAKSRQWQITSEMLSRNTNENEKKIVGKGEREDEREK